MATRRYGPYAVEISRPDKPLFPDGTTKGEVVDYYARVADVLLPHVAGRPLMLRRFPDGIAVDGFYQHDAPEWFPAWLRRASLAKEGGEVRHVVADKVADLAFLAGQAVVELHAWQSRVDSPSTPDRLVLDLDPPAGDARGFALARQAALALRGLLEELGLAPFVKTTGSKGLHVVCPIRPERGFDEVRTFAGGVARLLASREPATCTLEQRKSKRGGRVYLDTLRNSWAHTVVAPYSLRALPGAPVATPLTWDELADPELTPRGTTMRNLFGRLDRMGGPWKGMGRRARSLEGPSGRLAAMLAETRPAASSK